MARKPESGGRSFAEFLKSAPSLDEAASDDSVELTGLVSRTADGRFAITTDGGQTYELDVEAVSDFREEQAAGAAAAATIRISRDVLSKAVLRPIKPMIKDLIKDPIKDIIHDGKNMITDPIVDHKSLIKDVHKDPLSDPPKSLHKDPAWDPKHPTKDIHKDPLQDPITQVQELAKGPSDPIGVDPGFDPRVNPQAPFVMATPHQAPQHLLSMQAGVGAMPQPKRIETLKEPITDTHKESIFDTLKEVSHDTQKEMIYDTRKELILDTYKEMVWDTLVEGGPNTLQEGVFDPGQVVTQPGFGPGM